VKVGSFNQAPPFTPLQSEINIQHVDLEDDFVSIINRGTGDQSLHKWTLSSEIYPHETYTFPDREIPAGSVITVWACPMNLSRGTNNFHWPEQHFPWNPRGDVIVLKNASDIPVHKIVIGPPNTPLRNVLVQELDLQKQSVTIINKEATSINLADWRITTKNLLQYVFKNDPGEKKGFILQAGQSATIWGGEPPLGRVENSPVCLIAKDLKWDKQGDYARLYNSDNVFIDEVVTVSPYQDTGTLVPLLQKFTLKSPNPKGTPFSPKDRLVVDHFHNVAKAAGSGSSSSSNNNSSSSTTIKSSTSTSSTSSRSSSAMDTK